MDNYEIVDHINEAIRRLLLEKRRLQPNVHERSFGHQLAVHMEDLFKGWDIDCEYNKHGMLTKRLEGIRQCDAQRASDSIYPDIIVHERTNESTVEKNLLVIEMKKNDSCDECDKMKLQLLTKDKGQYRYQLGLYINIANYVFEKTWYKNSEMIEESDLLRGAS